MGLDRAAGVTVPTTFLKKEKVVWVAGKEPRMDL